MTMNRAAFYAALRPNPFGGTLTAAQVAGMEAILDAAPVGTPLEHLAYALATTFHETARTMLPIEEYGKGKGKAYGVPVGPWHKVYDGRGDVQLTWQANYAKATKRLRALGLLKAGEDLEQSPELAMRADLAAAILFVGMAEGWFTGKKLADYFGAGRSDPVNARRIINGIDRADEIAGYFRRFRDALLAAGYAPGAATAPPSAVSKISTPPAPAGAPVSPPKVASGGLFSWLHAALSRKPA